LNGREIKDTERGIVAQLAGEINEYIRQGAWPEFGLLKVEGSVSGRFPDMIVCLSDGTPFAIAEFKQPKISPHTDYLNALEKARNLGCDYFITSNFNETTIWRVPGDRVERFGPVGITSLEDLKNEQRKIALLSSWERVMNLLVGLKREGIAALTPASQSRFFTELITQRINALLPEYELAFGKASRKTEFLRELRAWAAPQGIPTELGRLLKVSSMQALYRLAVKIMFYFVMRRYWPELPSLEGVNPENITDALRAAFGRALKIDFHAVFEEDIIDTVELTPNAREGIADLVSRLAGFHFETAPLDVVGTIYENLIPHSDRYKLGQYFTPVPVVDLIIALTVNSGNDVSILDPTCGTGTFLQRAYDWFRNKHGTRKHEEIIPRLWGVDIARFPAELATVNLYRQDPSKPEVFPRIIREDFMRLLPGQEVEFKHPLQDQVIREPLPRFSTIVGNPPYVRQENIESVSRGYKKLLSETLMADGYDIAIKGTTDIFVYIFLHALRHLTSRGRLGFITSNAYTSTDYGVEFKRILLNDYTLRYIVASWAEPWFTQVEVNTLITVVENAKPMEDGDPLHFVALKKPLDELAPDEPFQPARHWHRLHALKGLIDAAPFKAEKTIKWRGNDMSIYEDEHMRVISLPQNALLPEENWMIYLRAPDVYFELMGKVGDRFLRLGEIADLRFGLKCGIKEFFILSDEDVKIHKIESELLRPVITSPASIKDSLVAKPDAWLFVCDLDMEELRRYYPNAWRYVKEGETRETRGGHGQRRRGVKFPDVPSVKHFKRWYTLPEQGEWDFLSLRLVGERIFFSENPDAICASDNFFIGIFKDREQRELYLAIMNSTITCLAVELTGRVNQGAGVMNFYGPELEGLPVPNAEMIDHAIRNKIVSAFGKLKSRPPMRIQDEVKQNDRQELDRLVLEALGLAPDEYLPRIYDGLVRVVSDRVNLGKLRKQKAREAREKDIARLIDQIVESLAADGKLRSFPEAFVPPRVLREGELVPLPGKPLEYEEFMGSLILKSEGQKLEISDRLSGPAKLFVFYAAKPGRFAVRVPKDEAVVRKAIEDFRAYANDLRAQLESRLVEMTGDHIQARILLSRLLDELGLSVALNYP